MKRHAIAQIWSDVGTWRGETLRDTDGNVARCNERLQWGMTNLQSPLDGSEGKPRARVRVRRRLYFACVERSAAYQVHSPSTRKGSCIFLMCPEGEETATHGPIDFKGSFSARRVARQRRYLGSLVPLFIIGGSPHHAFPDFLEIRWNVNFFLPAK